MAKRFWISIPLVTASEANDAAVVSFLKGGLKKELEVEAAAFITKWMFDKDMPFSIDFDSATVDRNAVMIALPKRVQKALGMTSSGITAAGDFSPQAEALSTEGAAVETNAEAVEVATELAGDQPEAISDEPADQP